MFPPLQKRRPTLLDHPTSSDQRNPSRSPQSWFRPVSSPAKTQHSHRAFGFSSIRELGRSSSRQTLRALQTTSAQQPYSHGCSPPKDGGLRQPIAAKDLESSLLSDSGLQRSRGSSIESLPIDKSGISSDSTYATTPSPAKHRAFQLLESSSPLQGKSMGNKASKERKKSKSVEGNESSVTATKDTETPPSPSHRQASTGSPKPSTFSARGSSVLVNVPRRRSSLTVLHLDSSHFETPDPRHRNLQHRASTLTEPGRGPNVLVEAIRPVTTIMPSSSNTTPTIQVQRETLSPAFLSPPLLSPPLSTSQPSPASSQAPSFRSRNSAVPAFIHLPKTFPDGPIPVPAPPLTITHHKCYQSHRRVLLSRNKFNPVPCMTCGETEGEARWKCVWCALRICGVCMAEFDAKHRNLDKFLAGREKRKDGSKESGSKDEVQELDGGREQTGMEKENVPSDRALQKQSTTGLRKLLTASD